MFRDAHRTQRIELFRFQHSDQANQRQPDQRGGNHGTEPRDVHEIITFQAEKGDEAEKGDATIYLSLEVFRRAGNAGCAC